MTKQNERRLSLTTPTSVFPNLDSFFLGFDDPFYHMNRISKQNIGYPFYDIEKKSSNAILKTPDQYRIKIALAGFKRDDITIIKDKALLIISGSTKLENDGWESTYSSISKKDFVKEFTLGDGVQIDDVSFKDGILEINMHHEVPEEDRPQTIKID